MAWIQIYCPKCNHHLHLREAIKHLPVGAVYRCPKCKHEFGVRTRLNPRR